MDLFARTFLPAAGDTGLSMPVICRYLTLLRRWLGPTEAVLLVSRCVRPEHPLHGEHLLVLTRHRLVVVRQNRLGHRLRLHLDAPIHELSAITWRVDYRVSALDFAATAIDGIRERFWIKTRHPKATAAADTAFGHVFRAATDLAPAA